MHVVCSLLLVLVGLRKSLHKIGYRDWKHATGKQGMLQMHNNCHTHNEAMVYVKDNEMGTTIADRLDYVRRIRILENRHYMKTVAEVVLLCARQDIALRGHRESQSSLNRGNFLEILHLVAQHDTVVRVT